MGYEHNRRVARVALSRLVEPGTYDAGPGHDPTAILGEVCDDKGLSLNFALDDAEEFLANLPSSIRFLTPEDQGWPQGLGDLHRAEVSGMSGMPFGLWLRGQPLDVANAVAIVGSRASTAYGNAIAGDMAGSLASLDHTVVSGAAFGIDQAAHRGALAVRGATVAVLAYGVDKAYPVAHADLIERIAVHGTVVSEYPPGCTPTRTRFLARNRIIAALTEGTVVVEAAERSGSLSMAAWAAKLGRPLMAVPGPVTSVTSVGTNRLIKQDKADLVTTGSDVHEVLERESAAKRRRWIVSAHYTETVEAFTEAEAIDLASDMSGKDWEWEAEPLA
jgi:DNA processing protein